MQPVLIMSDTHFHPYKVFSHITETGLNSRLDLIRIAFIDAVARASLKGCKLLVITGDIFHVRGSIRPSVLNVVLECLAYAKKLGMEIILLAGNHDMENYRKGDTAIDAFQGDNGIHAISYTQRLLANGKQILAIPYIHSVEEFKETYEREHSEHPAHIVLIHQGVDDFRPNTGLPETKITAEYLQSKTNGIIVSGHYHKPFTSGRVLSPGSLVPHSFGSDGIHGFWILNDAGFEFFESKHPKFVTHAVKDKADISEIKAKGNFARIKTIDFSLVKDIEKFCKDNECLGHTIYVEKEFSTSHSKAIELTNPETMLSEYIDLQPDLKSKKAKILDLYHHIKGTS